MTPKCQACGFTVFNRRYPKCERCGVELAPGVALSREATRSLQAAEQEVDDAAWRERQQRERDRHEHHRGAPDVPLA